MRSPDPGDDYLITLAERGQAVIVSGYAHLLGLAEQLPVYSPAEFLRLLEGRFDPDEPVTVMLMEAHPLQKSPGVLAQ